MCNSSQREHACIFIFLKSFKVITLWKSIFNIVGYVHVPKLGFVTQLHDTYGRHLTFFIIETPFNAFAN